MISAVVTVAPPRRPRAARVRSISSSKRTDTEPAPAPRRRSSDAVGVAGRRRLGRHVAHVLAEEERGVGQA